MVSGSRFRPTGPKGRTARTPGGTVWLPLTRGSGQQRDVLVCDETPFSCLQDQGRGKLPASGAEAKGKTNYIVALTTADHAPKPITLYYYSPTRSAENIGRILEDYNFETLVTDGYSGYRTILNNRNQDKPILDHKRTALRRCQRREKEKLRCGKKN